MNDDTNRQEPIEEQSVAPESPVDPAEQAAAAMEDTPTDPLQEAQAQADQYLNNWKRAAADLQNYKKQTDKQRQLWVSMANQDLILSLLPLFDDLDQAIHNVPEEISQSQWYEGVMLIRRKMLKVLMDSGLEEIEAEGQAFDPRLHEAVMQEPSEEAESGTVTHVLQKGYRLSDRVIRPAMVKVAE